VNVRFTDEAFAGLARIEQFHTRHGPRIVSRIVEKCALLAAHPQLGRVVPERGRPDLRELIEARHRVFYVVDVDEIRVVAVFHGSAIAPDVELDPIDDV